MPTENVQLSVRGQDVPALLFLPEGSGPFPGVAVGQEATGPNRFIRETAADLVGLGYAVIVPDYYHGGGPADPEDYADIEEIMRHVGALDFRHAAYDVMAGLDHLRSLPQVDADRLAVWGYCTGASIALLAAALRADLGGAVLFYPSQPRFDALGVNKPVHPVDMLWNLSCPVLLLAGDADPVWPAELVEEVKGRLAQWGVDHEFRIYPGAGHAFSAPSPLFHHAEAHDASWADASAFLRRVVPPR